MFRSVKTIVVGIAGVSKPDPLIPPAIEIAERIGATLHFVLVCGLPDPLLEAYARDGYLGEHFGENYTGNLRNRLESHVRAISSSDKIVCHAVLGPTSESLCEQAELLNADLIIVGGTRSGRFMRKFLGSTAERVIRGSRIPVLVLRKPFARPLERVLLTTDLSEFSAGVHERGSELVHALFPEDQPHLRSLLVIWHDLAMPSPLVNVDMRRVASSELSDFLAQANRRGEQVEGKVRMGQPTDEINSEAGEWPADLLVIGTHGRSGASRFLLGSVAENTIRATEGNVLVLPPVPVPRTENSRSSSEVAHVIGD